VENKITEIKAHHLGVEKLMTPKGDYTVIDIGGQDAKIIESKESKVHRFTMNRKCAAGTGAFIEELAHRLEIDLSEMTEIASKHDKELLLSSYCTVFAVQEMVKILVSGEKLENLVQAVYNSIISRVLEMTELESDQVFLSGGVLSNHPTLQTLFSKRLADKTFTLVPNAQYTGAIGAAFSQLI
jgi:predicted CoA-substrate-specific enzyme activase